MKVIITALAAGLLVSSFGAANAAVSKQERKAMAQTEASCKAQAKQKFSAVHFLKRRAYVKQCMGRSHQAQAVTPAKKVTPATTTR